MYQITENLYAIFTKGKFLNYFLIANRDTLTVIDIALGSSDVDRLEHELSEKSWSIEQVKYILITHAHPDHIGGLAELQKRTNAHTYVHRLDAPIVRGEQSQVFADVNEVGFFTRMMISMMKGNTTTPARVDTELTDGDVLNDILHGLEVIHLPGHSYGHSGFWLPAERILIGGDVMMNFPWGLGFPLRMPSPDWVAVKDSIRKVADMNPKMLCVAHGSLVTENVSEKINRLLAK